MRQGLPEFISPKTASEILQCSRSTIQRLVDAGEFPVIRFQKTVRIDKKAFAEWLADKKHAL